MVEVNYVTGLCNTVYSFFLRQIYWHIPVKMELWSSIVVFVCRLQFSLDNLYLFLASTGQIMWSKLNRVALEQLSHLCP